MALSLARALTQQAEVVGEINGRVRHAQRRTAARHRIAKHRALRRPVHDRKLAGGRGLLFGFTSHDPDVGFAAGFTYVFDAFQVP